VAHSAGVNGRAEEGRAPPFQRPGMGDHTTVMHGTEKIERALATDPELRGELAAIRAQVAGG